MSLQSFNYDDFRGGINTEASEFGLSELELVEAQDVIITDKGRIRKRSGYRRRENGDSYSTIACTDVLAAGRLKWQEDSRCVLVLCRNATDTLLYLLPPAGVPLLILTWSGVSYNGDMFPAKTRPDQSNPNVNSKTDGMIVTCDKFAVVVQFDSGAFAVTEATRDHQIRRNPPGAGFSDYVVQFTYLRGSVATLGGTSDWATSDGATYTTSATVAPVFDYANTLNRRGWKTGATGDLYSIGANSGIWPQHFWWSNDRQTEEGGEDSHSWNAEDYEHLPVPSNGKIIGVRPLNSQYAFLKSDGIIMLNATPDPADFSRRVRSDIGCLDVRSAQYYRGDLIIAAREGVYRFNGQNQAELSGNIRTMWNDRVRSFGAGYRIVGAVVEDYYFVNIMDSSNVQIGGDCLVCHLPSQTWTTVSNLNLENSCLHEDGVLTYGFLRVGSNTRIILLNDILNEDLSQQDSIGTGPSLIVQMNRLVAGDPTGMKRFRYIITDYVAQTATGTPAIKLQYTTNLRRSRPGEITWAGETTLDTEPATGGSFPDVPNTIRRMISLHSVGIGIRITEDTTSGTFFHIDLNAIRVGFKSMRPGRVWR